MILCMYLLRIVTASLSQAKELTYPGLATLITLYRHKTFLWYGADIMKRSENPYIYSEKKGNNKTVWKINASVYVYSFTINYVHVKRWETLLQCPIDFFL